MLHHGIDIWHDMVLNDAIPACLFPQILAKEAAAVRNADRAFSIKVWHNTGLHGTFLAVIGWLCIMHSTPQLRYRLLPTCVQVGGTEISPFIIWGGIAFLLYGSLRGLMAAGNAISGRQGRGKGKWVYDRSLGGKKVS
jgi:hypothetical protein